MGSSGSVELVMGDYTIRRFHQADAIEITRLVKLVYGDTYYPPDLYDAAKIVELNADGRLVSIVAIDGAFEVVGHYALERPHPAAVAEASDAIVQPQHRHHHVMEEMRILLWKEAQREGLAGVVGYPVTNHLYSQLAEDHFGAHPCGVALGLWPKSFHNMPEALPQRMSFVIYFKYLQDPREVVHVETRHSPICGRISQQYSVQVKVIPAEPARGVGEIVVEQEVAVQAGAIRVKQVGADTIAAIREARTKLCDGTGIKALILELPLFQPGTAEVCRAAEDDGFYFCGLGPAFASGGDALLLQYVVEDVDLSLVQVESPFAKELLAYVGHERDRVRGSKQG